MFFIAMKLLENVIFCNAFCNTSCHCFYYNETIGKCDDLVLTIPLVTVSIATKPLENVMFCF